MVEYLGKSVRITKDDISIVSVIIKDGNGVAMTDGVMTLRLLGLGLEVEGVCEVATGVWDFTIPTVDETGRYLGQFFHNGEQVDFAVPFNFSY